MDAGTNRFRVAVDCSALDPDDELPVRFMGGLARHAKDVDFVLLTPPGAAVRGITADNVTCVGLPPPDAYARLVERVEAHMPGQARREQIRRALRLSRFRRSALLRRSRPNVVLSPFTRSSSVFDPSVPLVGAVADVRHIVSPHLLTSRQRARRARGLAELLRDAAVIVCSSDSVASALVSSNRAGARRIVTLAPGPLLVEETTVPPPGPTRTIVVPTSLGPCDNDALVLTAMGLFRARHPRPRLRLVFGVPAAADAAPLAETIRRFGLSELATIDQRTPTWPGVVLIPTLYDTTGCTALNAMARGRAVICSHVPELLEVTAGAALTFDAHRPDALAAAFERIETEPDLVNELARAGRERFDRLPRPADIASRFIDVLRRVTWQPASR